MYLNIIHRQTIRVIMIKGGISGLIPKADLRRTELYTAL